MFSFWRGNMHGYLSADIIRSKILTFSLKRNLRKLSGGGDRGVRVSRFPYHVLPPPVLLSVAPVFRWMMRIRNPGFNFQTVPKINILVHFLDRYKIAWHMCQVACYLMTSDVIEFKWFPNSPEVMLFFQPEYKIYVFLLPKFSLKHWWMLNGNFKTFLNKCFWLNDTQ